MFIKDTADNFDNETAAGVSQEQFAKKLDSFKENRLFNIFRFFVQLVLFFQLSYYRKLKDASKIWIMPYMRLRQSDTSFGHVIPIVLILQYLILMTCNLKCGWTSAFLLLHGEGVPTFQYRLYINCRRRHSSLPFSVWIHEGTMSQPCRCVYWQYMRGYRLQYQVIEVMKTERLKNNGENSKSLMITSKTSRCFWSI